MPQRKSRARPVIAAPSPSVGAPEVMVDFVFDAGVFHLCVANLGAAPAYQVSVAFSPAFRGLGGTKDMTRLALFRKIAFLAPGRRIETLLDHSANYFRRREPTRIDATIAYRDAEGRRYVRKIPHDLSIYKDVSYRIAPAAASANSGSLSSLEKSAATQPGMPYVHPAR